MAIHKKPKSSHNTHKSTAVGTKIRKLKKEGKSQKAAVGQAMAMTSDHKRKRAR